MKVTRTEEGGIAILRLEGEFDSFETELVRQHFEACVEAGRHRVVLDLSGLTFANSTTIAYLITAQKQAQKLGGKVVLAQPGEFILKTLRTLGLDQLFAIQDSVAGAVSELSSS
ncbi:MAG: STAS domain-containing protein [Planctomycetota bacterium]|jgi:anti-anti-sigma factor